MKIGSKAKRILTAVLVAVLGLGVCLAAGTVIKQNKKSALVADAYAAYDVVGELYNSDNTFSGVNLTALANKAGYSDIDTMIADAATPKNASYMVQKNNNAEWSVTLGGLIWNPMYLSQTNDGQAILTLWLAANEAVSTWSDGTYGTDTRTYTETSTGTNTPLTVYCNSYDGSYIRNYVFRGDLNYAQYFGTSWHRTPETYDSVKNTFAPFRTSGGIGDYIVTPSKVQWQIAESTYKNDIGYTGTYYSNYWQNDKIWLPGMTEVYDGSGGLWGTSANQRSNRVTTLLRTGHSNYYDRIYNLMVDGGSAYPYLSTFEAVRPALHLNLTEALKNAKFPHTHSFGEWTITKQPTCTKAGERSHTCSAANCPLPGGVETETIPIDNNAHDWGDWTTATPATCTSVGTEEQKCNLCGKKQTKEIAKLSHEYDTEYTEDKAATCTDTGSKSRHCKNDGCDDKTDVQTLSVLGHDWGEWESVNAGDCTTNGLKRRTCKRTGCGATEDEEVKAKGHQYQDTVIKPDCTTEGYTEHKCTVCGDIKKDTTVAAAGHKYGDPTWNWGTKYLTATAKFSCSVCHTEKEEKASVTHDSATASCTVAGDITHKATVKFEEKDYSDEKTEAGNKLPHDSEIITVTLAATCTTDGAAEYKCKTCNQQYTDIISALGHDFAAEFTEDLAATCTTEGSKSKHCSRCEEKDEVTVISATGHTAGDAATCENAQTCTVCNAELAAALGHDWGEWETTKSATYTEEGEKKRKCSRCDGCETEAIPTLGSLENQLTLTLSASFYYGDEIKPIATAKYGEVTFAWFDSNGAELTEKPVAAGTYKLVASVAKSVEGGYSGVSKEAEFVIKPRKITVTINAAESEQSQDLAELSATVTTGTVLTGDNPYLLTTDADRETVGTYTITGTCVDGNYEITFVDGVYTVKERTVTPPPVDDNPTDDPNTDKPNEDDNKPVQPGVTDPGDNSGGGFAMPEGFPLWQVSVGGVSLVACVILAASIASCAGRIKRFNKRADKLASKSFAAGVMINGMLFSVSNTWWTVISLSLAGLAVVLFIVLMIVRRALRNAQEALEEAQDNYNESRMIMMMRNPQPVAGGYTVNVPQIDMDELSKRVAAALLPNMQKAAAQITAGSEYNDSELRRRIEDLESKDDGFDDLVEVDMDELQG